MSRDRVLAAYRAGDVRGAAQACVDLLRRDPDDVDALVLLGGFLNELGHAEDALGVLDRAVGLRKRHPGAHANRGVVLGVLGRREDAIAALRTALRLDPELNEARQALAMMELMHGDRLAAARTLAELLVRQPSRDVAILFADALLALADPPGDLEPALTIALDLDGVDHSRLDRAIRAALDPLRDDPDALLAAPLLPRWLSRVVCAHPDWEGALVQARRRLLERVRQGTAPEEVVRAFARHAHACEHCWPTDEPLDGLPDLARATVVPTDLPEVRAEVDRERTLAAAIPEFSGDHPSNEALRAMYEESPYPRLVSVHAIRAQPFAGWLRARFPGATPPAGPVDVLVAGCGTGRHALQSALAWSDARVLAIDLSRASLGRAARLAEAHGLGDLSFARGDLLEVARLGRTFDVVEAVGVLHHLEDPRAGWAALRGVLKPGGLMRIGLYAERARQDVVAARELVAGLGLRPDADGIRAARAAILALPDDHPARPIVWSPDFYSRSGCRDLVFHVREHRTTPLRLRDDLAALDLELVGFQHALAQVPAAYRERWPDDEPQVDLERWDQVEGDLPRAFAGMYVFWAAAR